MPFMPVTSEGRRGLQRRTNHQKQRVQTRERNLGRVFTAYVRDDDDDDDGDGGGSGWDSLPWAESA
ncbi:hypothetical protein RRF57_000978 [Xylaria bambusicola]|uniref:Uncharacterized protein n=1 Tax=Xylaria bambusicola TaxID=326684 RepID=A0AAN7Z099_9PEZI